ncbi:MAG TPA: ATP-dependent DNA helicase [Usitatibacteraceae bacterium]|nr:ATP-dependent DNA helicase [Usitatibacteraceae bacterium]
MDELTRIFAPDGPLAARISGFRQRVGQLEMAERVAEAIRSCSVLVAEAGTGTGKTFAYLVPALLSGGKTVISTGTKTLQDQLFHRDLPTVIEALRIPASTALLKGRANYVCLHHLERAQAEGRFGSREDARHIHAIRRFADRSLNGLGSGDRSELSEVPERSSAWPLAVSTRENCLGAQCAHFADCFLMKARKAALEAEVVVVNHHLFFADLVLKDEGAQDLLPACNTVVFDEAHQLPEVATLFLGQSVSTGQLVELARDTRLAAVTHAADSPGIGDAAGALDKAARDLRLVLQEDSARLAGAEVTSRDGFAAAMASCEERLAELRAVLEGQAERAQELANCLGRADEYAMTLAAWKTETTLPEGFEVIRWAEAFGHSLVLHTSPLSVARAIREQVLATRRAWIFTSATLSVRGDFAHYQEEMGLTEASEVEEFGDSPRRAPHVVTAGWESPFDFASQALLYVPAGLPLPNSSQHTEAVVRAALPLIRAAGGRTFMLFTSLRAMDHAHRLLSETRLAEGLDWPLMTQGEGTRSELLARFRELGNAVLLASHSFWEGVDVKGDALSLVVIDKLPFAPPDDPVLAARIDAIARRGGNPFMSYQVPAAAIALKQGAGRLIRDESDRGVLMIADTRVVEKPYGRRIWQSLPPMRRTRDETEALNFLRAALAGRACA